MAFELTPTTAPASPPESVDVEVIDFIGATSVINVTRGVGESSHVVTVKMAYVAASASPWNSGNEAPTDSWAFSEADFLATMTTVIP